MNHKELAMNNFLKGCNCSQSIMLAFCDVTGIDEKTALRLSSSFGGGMGRLREVCGAFSGMLLVAGILYGYDDVEDPELKSAHYKRVQELADLFKEETRGGNAENGSMICRELLGLSKGENTGGEPSKRTAEYYAKRPCKEIIGKAADILDKYIEKNPLK
ncbi:MAG: C_GCAxxG_C_C family protein [Clostridia bacterium]|nr:C_GCAxxG_C_C family protein [Clostridia bacterium]